MPPDLADDEKVALIELLRSTVDRDRSLTSPRIRKLQAILAKLALEPPRQKTRVATMQPVLRSPADGPHLLSLPLLAPA